MINKEDAEDIKTKAKGAQETPVHVALFGQPGSGKSSLINAILGQELAPVGVQNDVTTERHDYEWNGLFLIDLPGYGTEKFPADHYIDQFGVLKFDVFLCVTSGKLRDSDIAFFRQLCSNKKPCIFVRNKIDAEFERGKTDQQLRSGIAENLFMHVGQKVKVVFTSCKTSEGVDELEEEIAKCLPDLKRARFLRSARAYSKEFLNRKREACRSYAILAAASAAVVNAVPLPGLGFAADATSILATMAAIRNDFGLTETRLDAYKHLFPAVAPIVTNVIQFGTREGVLWLLRQAAGLIAVQEASKYVPFVGPVISASIGFLVVRYILFNYIDECYGLAKDMLERHFES